jgi:hypothetical protein
MFPVKNLFEEREEISNLVSQRKNLEINLDKMEKKKKIQAKMEQEKEEKYKKLLLEFRGKNLGDTVEIKKFAQKLLNHLDIQLLEIGRVEYLETKDNLPKLSLIPYKIMGDPRKIALFFYYLENSRYILLLGKTGVQMIDVNLESNLIQVKFKLGYYEEESEKNIGIKEKGRGSNPLKYYLSDKVYYSGIKKFYGKNIFQGKGGKNSKFQEEIDKKFKLITIIRGREENTAGLYYTDNSISKRIIVKGRERVDIGKESYTIYVEENKVKFIRDRDKKIGEIYFN